MNWFENMISFLDCVIYFMIKGIEDDHKKEGDS